MGAFKGRCRRRLDIKIVNSEQDSHEDIGFSESDLCFKAFLVLAHHGLDKRQMQFLIKGRLSDLRGWVTLAEIFPNDTSEHPSQVPRKKT